MAYKQELQLENGILILKKGRKNNAYIFHWIQYTVCQILTSKQMNPSDITSHKIVTCNICGTVEFTNLIKDPIQGL
jgi:hypothetical protein